MYVCAKNPMGLASYGSRTFILLSGEDVNTNQVDLSATVLSGLGGGHINDLAREFLRNAIGNQSQHLHQIHAINDKQVNAIYIP